VSYPDYRALCAELLDGVELDVAEVENPARFHALLDRARAALAQPEAIEPTDEDLEAWRQAAIAQFEASGYDIPASRTVALLAIEWCRRRDLSAIAPVPVSEQPGQPGPVAPTDEESFALWKQMESEMNEPPDWRDFDDFARAYAAHWGRPAPQPGPVAPTDEELDELWAEIDGGGAIRAWQPYARAVLARWGSPNPTTATSITP
jgi:hypothetical protein